MTEINSFSHTWDYCLHQEQVQDLVRIYNHYGLRLQAVAHDKYNMASVFVVRVSGDPKKGEPLLRDVTVQLTVGEVRELQSVVVLEQDEVPYDVSIQPVYFRPGRTGSLSHFNMERVAKRLGFNPNLNDDPVKIGKMFGFQFNGKKAAIWRYKGSNTLSWGGSFDLMCQVFGNENVQLG